MKTHNHPNPSVVLAEGHRTLNRLLDRLLAAVRADDREAQQRVWARLEKALAAHLDVEEKVVFPAITDAFPEEVAGLRHEHDDLRRELATLGLAFELHTIRAKGIERLCESLRRHAAREESLAYRAADQSVTAEDARALLRRLERWVGLAEEHDTSGSSKGDAP